MSFDPITSPIDYILLNGAQSPGIAEVKGAGSPRQWDERRGFGMTGAISVYRGAKLSHFSVVFTLWLAEHFADWETFSEPIKRPPSRVRGQSRNLSIWHPILEDLGITQVGVEDVLQPVQTDDGKWDYEVKFLAYHRPRLALARPDGSADGTQVNPQDVELDVLTAQANALTSVLDP